MTDDMDDEGGFKLMDRSGREISLNARRWMLAVLEGADVVLGPQTSLLAAWQLCQGFAMVAASQMVAHAELERGLSPAEAEAESAAGLREEIAELELLLLDDGEAPFPGGLTLPESSAPDMSPAEAQLAGRVWGFVADVAVEGRSPCGSVPAEIAESLATILLGYITGTHTAAGMTQDQAAEAAMRAVTSYRDLYGSLGAEG